MKLCIEEYKAVYLLNEFESLHYLKLVQWNNKYYLREDILNNKNNIITINDAYTVLFKVYE